MFKLLDGPISYNGIRDNLDAVSKLRHVKNGVMRITSAECSGVLGIFCGRFITGAVVARSGEIGHSALRQLLHCSSGDFAFHDAGKEVFPELAQALAVDLQLLLSSNQLDSRNMVTVETLTGMAANPEEVRAIDTTVDVSPPEDEEARLGLINRTYERLLSLSSQRVMQTTAEQVAAGQAADQAAEEQAAVERIATERMHAPVSPSGTYTPEEPLPPVEPTELTPAQVPPPMPLPSPTVPITEGYPQPIEPPKKKKTGPALPIPAWDVPPEVPSVAPGPSTTYSRLKKWSNESDVLKVSAMIAALAVLIIACAIMLPRLLSALAHRH